ncbi:MAG: hypothetical protein JWN61_3325, partial [Pseudonocardiales bacterium]|nr:hypothetical protein [Pseudonocardiales bacterium]
MSRHRRIDGPPSSGLATMERPDPTGGSERSRWGKPARGKAEPESAPSPSVTMAPAMTRGQRWQFRGLVLTWVGVTGFFWHWWLSSGHVGTPVLFVAVSLSFLYIATLLPSFYMFYVGQMR